MAPFLSDPTCQAWGPVNDSGAASVPGSAGGGVPGGTPVTASASADAAPARAKGLGSVFFLSCPSRRCPIITSLAKDVRSMFGS